LFSCLKKVCILYITTLIFNKNIVLYFDCVDKLISWQIYGGVIIIINNWINRTIKHNSIKLRKGK
jgi:hypothetical protein